MDAEKVAGELAERVRELIADAQKRAEEIVRGAEAEAQRLREEAGGEAQRIREEAEAQARERLDQVRQALEQLEAGLSAKRAPRTAKPEPKARQDEPEAPEEELEAAKPEPEAPEPEPAAPEQAPGEVSTDELIEQLKAGGRVPGARARAGAAGLERRAQGRCGRGAPGGDEVRARRHLARRGAQAARRRLRVADLDSLLDEVYSKAGK